MKDHEIEQLIKDKSEVSKQIMREIHNLVEMLEESGQGDFTGFEAGWQYSFSKEKPEPKKEYPWT